MIAIIAGGVLLTMILFEASVHTYPGNSDGATVVLEGAAMNAGHLTLHGWSMTVESFWSVDAVFYMAAVRLIGLQPLLLHLVPAVIAALIIVVGGFLARRGSHGAGAIAATATVVLLIGLPSPDLGYYLLQGPWHVATTLWCLIAFAALVSRKRWAWGVAVVLLAMALLGDAMAVSLGLLPLFVFSLCEARRLRQLRRALPILAAVLASVGLALALRALAVSIGTFELVNRNVPIDSTQIRWNLHHLPSLFAALLGWGQLSIAVSPGPLPLQLLHLLGIVVVLAGAAAALVSLVRNALRPPAALAADATFDVGSLLCLAFFSDLATFVLVSPTANPNCERYLIPGVIFGAILAGRLVGVVVPRLHSTRLTRAAVGSAVLAGGVFGLDVVGCLAAPAPPQPADQLVDFLSAHHLTEGIGDYWSSSVVTVESGGSVIVRPVTNNTHGVLLRYDRQSSTTWYANQRFQFFVYNTGRPWRQVNAKSAAATFGAPVETDAVGTYRVLIWRRPVTLSAALPPQPDPVRLYWRL